MNLKHIRNLFLIFIIILMLYAAYLMMIKNIAMKNETVSKSLIFSENEKITHLKLGISEFDTINPILTQNKDFQYISKLIYDSLFTVSEDYRIKSSLATECSQISDKSYVIKLRESVYWSNGEKFSAKDVIYTIEKIKTEENIYKELVESIENIQIVDEYTIKITLYEETMFFEYNLIFPIIKNNSIDEVFCSIGMYVIEEIDENKITLTRNKKWWNREIDETVLENITINIYSNKLEEYKAFKKAEIDIINTNNIYYEEFIGKYGYNTEEYVCPKHTVLAFNMGNKFLENLNVRQAIEYSIDKQNIVNTVFDNKYVSSDFPLDYGSFLYTDNLYEHIYNPKQGNEILNKSVNKSVNNFDINLKLIVKDMETDKVKIAELIKKDLENIGIIINVVKLNENEYEKELNNKNYDLLLCTIDLSLNPNLEALLGDENLFGYNNFDVIKIIDEIRNIKDQKILIQKYEELQMYYYEDIPYISLYNEVNTLLYSKNLRAILNPNYFNLFYGIEKWYLVKEMNYVG